MAQAQLDSFLQAKDVSAIKAFIDEQSSDAKPLTESKPLMNHLATNIGKLDNASTLEICNHAITQLKNRQL